MTGTLSARSLEFSRFWVINGLSLSFGTFLGRSRFKEFMASPEGIPTNILTDRLQKLTEHGLIEKKPVAEGAKRLVYYLTPKGKALRPTLQAMVDWSLKYEAGT